MVDNTKQERTTIKGLLTKSCNRVNKAINQQLSMGIIQTRFAEANKQWSALLEKNEIYLQAAYPDGNVPGSEEEWLEAVTEQFDKMEIMVDEALNSVHTPKSESSLEIADILYLFEEQTLSSMIRELNAMCDDIESTVQIISDYKNELKEQFNRFRESQRDLAKLGKACSDSAMNAQSEYNNAVIKAGKQLDE